ncbi:unnamed protein product [Rhizoctonia solani]|uniref:HSF-type DNA-binding domain-containing protein n=1 Tax=Rhizoctonia solani TaxID=456999 RepID=A0A8H3AIS6_9AGAM|nr:unnamed protein product [Rhizoctonia solani]
MSTMSSYSPQIYPPALPQSQPAHSHSQSHSQSPEHDEQDGDATPPKSADAQKLETKPQATFLTKLYALLERPEYQSMIRWDAAGEQIIVERPEQLALHVLPSIYRQSRFASFSRQLNIYGFMRKVNLRNVDPAIDDPDASTWSHPTLNRNSPPEVVANFKRRVPPRLPKPRKRDQLDMSRVGPGNLAPGMTVPSSTHPMALSMAQGKPRTRGFSAPSLPFGFAGTAHLQPAGQPQPYYNVAPPQKWGGGAPYGGTSLPPLTVPGEHTYGSSYGRHIDDPHAPPYGHSSQYPPHHSGQQLPVLRDPAFQYPGYGTGAPGSGADTSSWSFLPPASSLTSGHSGSLSSLLNPSANSGSYARPPSSGGFGHGSPDSRPNTGYSVASSVSSIGGGYDAGEQNPFALRPTTVGGRDDSGRPLGPSYGRHMDDPHASSYGHSSQYPPHPHHSGQQLPVLRDPTFQYPGYGTGAPGSGADTSSWSFLPPASSLTSGHSGSLSSLLNPSANSGSYARPPSSGGFGHGSPDSRPNTGYSVASSVSSIGGGGYDGGEQNPFALRPTTVGGRDDSGRPLTPTSAGGVRPGSSKGNGASSLSIRNGRPRRHSQVSPYPSPYSPYESEAGSRPGTAPDDHLGPQRSRSMAEPYGSFQGGPAPAEFAYSASGAGVDNGEWMGQRTVRPSTSTSTMSGHSPASNSALNTPPGMDDNGIATTPPASAHGPSGPFGASEDISRCE